MTNPIRTFRCSHCNTPHPQFHVLSSGAWEQWQQVDKKRLMNYVDAITYFPYFGAPTPLKQQVFASCMQHLFSLPLCTA